MAQSVQPADAVRNSVEFVKRTSLDFVFRKNEIAPSFATKEYIPLRVRFLRLLSDSSFGTLHDILLISMGVASCGLYVYDSYVGTWRGDAALQVIFSTYFAIEYLLRIYISEHRMEYVRSFMGIADLLSVLPILNLFLTFRQHSASFLRVFVIFRAARFVASTKMLTYGFNEVERQVMYSVTAVFTFLFCAAGLLHFIESVTLIEQFHDGSKGPDVPPVLMFHEALYYIIVTISTVGYGDITPITAAGRIFVTLMIVFAIFFIPVETGKVISVVSQTSAYSGSYKPSKSTTHVVVGGSASPTILRIFLRELCQQQIRGGRSLNIVVLRPVEPEPDVSSLIRSFRFRSIITYLKGSMLVEEDLHRAKIMEARAVIILADDFTTSPLEEDAATIHRALAIKKYYGRTATFIQLLRPLHADHVVNESFDLAICVNQLKMGILARATNCVGLSTLLCNLFVTHHQTVFMDENGRVSHALVLGANNNKLESAASVHGPGKQQDLWLAEYDHGYSHEVFLLQIGKAYAGMTFADAAAIMYTVYCVLLVAVEIVDPGTNKKRIMSLPESDFLLQEGDVGFVIATSEEFAFEVNQFEFGKMRQHDLDMTKESVDSIKKKFIAIARQQLGEHGPTPSTATQVIRLDAHRRAVLSRIRNEITRSHVAALHADIWERQSNVMKETSSHWRGGRRRPPRAAPGGGAGIPLPQPGGQEPAGEAAVEDGGAGSDAGASVIGGSMARRAPGRRARGPALPPLMAPQVNLTELPNAPPRPPVPSLQSRPRTATPLNEEAEPSPRGPGLPPARAMLPRNASMARSVILSSDTLDPSLPPGLKNHIVLTGTPNGATTFLNSLRAVGNAPNAGPDARKNAGRTVVILLPDAPPDRLVKYLEHESNAFVVQGSPLAVEDLERAGVQCAHMVVILVDQSQLSSVVSELSDSSAIQTALNVESVRSRRTQFVVEIVEEANMKYLDSWSGSSDVECRLLPVYAAGRVYMHSALQSILLQAYFRGPQIVHLLEKIVGVSATGYEDRPENRIYPSQIPVPSEFYGKTYLDLFIHFLVEKSLLPLGLYRAKKTSGSRLPYVYANPMPTTELTNTDLVFVLSRAPL
eukprot:tig00021522_g22095.t1